MKGCVYGIKDYEANVRNFGIIKNTFNRLQSIVKSEPNRMKLKQTKTSHMLKI